MKIWHRIYSDYLMPQRLHQFREICELAQARGYQQISIRQFWHLSEQEREQGPFLIHRHDVDTDPSTARALFEIEKSLGIHSSYYFRLGTWDTQLMQEIEAHGSEASYHYEELSTYCKQQGLTTAEQARAAMPAIRDLFRAHVRELEDRVGYKFFSVASHGDFVNHKIGVNNIEIVEQPGLLEELGLVCEARDESLMQHLPHYSIDKPYPIVYQPVSPHELLETGENVLFVSHPRQWRTHWRLNTKDNLQRYFEGTAFRRAQHKKRSAPARQKLRT